MGVQITIIGLGQIGTSIGLALAEHQQLVHRVGHDKDFSTAQRAKKVGAVDKVALNLISSVEKADLVLLALPMDQVRQTLELIARELKEGAVVMDTSPVKEVVSSWATELLPRERYYVGLTPVINPAYLLEAEVGMGAARADMFRDGLIAIVSPQGTPSEAIKLAADLTRLLGANPFFADPLEMDGVMAATHILPQLMAAALLNATVDQPGWREAGKVAGRAYTEATNSIFMSNEVGTLQASALLNRENVLRVIDGVLASLQSIRNDISDEDAEALQERLSRARRGREEWWKHRLTSRWPEEETHHIEAPTASDVFGRLLGLRRRKSK